jgi:hypothetical protein
MTFHRSYFLKKADKSLFFKKIAYLLLLAKVRFF